MYTTRNFLIFSLAFFGIAVSAGATTMTSTSYSGWLANATGPVDIFGNAPSSGSFSNSTGITLSNSSHPSAAFVFTGPDGTGWSLNAGLYTSNGHNFPALFGASDGKGNITVTMPSGGENAVMMSVASTAGSALTVKLSDGETFTPAAGIFGISLSHDISWLTISTGSGSEAVIDDFLYASSTIAQDASQQTGPLPTLEASTVAMIGGGLLILIGGRKKLFSNNG